MAYRLRVKEVLQEKGISQGLLSRGANIPIGMVRRMVRDPSYNPSGETLAKAARFLGVWVDDLYTFDENTPAT